jgi:hypothetical protein
MRFQLEACKHFACWHERWHAAIEQKQQNKKMKSIIKTMLAASLLAAGSSQAQELIADWTQTGDLNNNNAWTLGFSFNVNTPITVTGLAYYNPSAAGDAVGLWDANGNLLATTIVTSSDPFLGNGFLQYSSLFASVTLPDGTYTVGGENNGTQVYSYLNGGFSTIPQVTFLQDEFTLGPVLTMPTSSSLGGANGWFGGDVVINGSIKTNVPDGGSTMALLSSGLLALGAIRRKLS